jgi:hypothetical protein
MRTLPDLDSCVREWAALQPAARAALEQRRREISGVTAAAPSSVPATPSSSPTDLDPLVRRFRKLRESLTSCGLQDCWAVDVYELSADVCAEAGNTAELLKCLQALVNTLYPAARAQAARWRRRQQQAATVPGSCSGQQQAEASAAAAAAAVASGRSDHQDPWDEDGDALHSAGPQSSSQPSKPAAPAAAAEPDGPPLPREPEVHGALLFWFLCIPVRPVHAEVAKRLRATPPALLITPEFQLALAAASALLRGNWVRLFAAVRVAPPLMGRVLEAGLAAARGRAVRAMAVVYRSLPAAAACGALGVGGGAGCGAVLRQALVTAKDSLGSRGAGIALEKLDAALSADGIALADELQFR